MGGLVGLGGWVGGSRWVGWGEVDRVRLDWIAV